MDNVLWPAFVATLNMEQYTVTVNGKEYKLNADRNVSSVELDGKSVNLDVTGNRHDGWSILKDGRSHQVEFFRSTDLGTILLVNGRRYTIAVSDKYDELLRSLGMDRNAGAKVSSLKAPMPGKVLSVSVHSGSQVLAGDALLVLEAMKMENVIKSPTEGRIASVDIATGDAVEKNQVMITFE